jgi:hypothetical protein
MKLFVTIILSVLIFKVLTNQVSCRIGNLLGEEEVPCHDMKICQYDCSKINPKCKTPAKFEIKLDSNDIWGETYTYYFTCVLRPYQNWQTTTSPLAKLYMGYMKRWFRYTPPGLASACILGLYNGTTPLAAPYLNPKETQISTISWYYTILLFVKHICKDNVKWKQDFSNTVDAYISGSLSKGTVDLKVDPAIGNRILYQRALEATKKFRRLRVYKNTLKKLATIKSAFTRRFLKGDFDEDYCNCDFYNMMLTNAYMTTTYPVASAAIRGKMQNIKAYCQNTCQDDIEQDIEQ